MVRKKSLKGDYCPSARALDVIGDWWSLLIVREAFDGVTRFSAFQKNLGIARNILAERLRKLTGEGILEMVSDPNGGAHQNTGSQPRGAICCRSSSRCANGARTICLRLMSRIQSWSIRQMVKVSQNWKCARSMAARSRWMTLPSSRCVKQMCKF